RFAARLWRPLRRLPATWRDDIGEAPRIPDALRLHGVSRCTHEIVPGVSPRQHPQLILRRQSVQGHVGLRGPIDRGPQTLRGSVALARHAGDARSQNGSQERGIRHPFAFELPRHASRLAQARVLLRWRSFAGGDRNAASYVGGEGAYELPLQEEALPKRLRVLCDAFVSARRFPHVELDVRFGSHYLPVLHEIGAMGPERNRLAHLAAGSVRIIRGQGQDLRGRNP